MTVPPDAASVAALGLFAPKETKFSVRLPADITARVNAIVNEAFARRYWDGVPALGR